MCDNCILIFSIYQIFMLQAHWSIPGHVTFSAKSILTSNSILISWEKHNAQLLGESQGWNILCNDITYINQSEHSNIGNPAVLKGKMAESDHVDDATATSLYPVLFKEDKKEIWEGKLYVFCCVFIFLITFIVINDLSFKFIQHCLNMWEIYSLTTIRTYINYKNNNLKQLKFHVVFIQYAFNSGLTNGPEA